MEESLRVIVQIRPVQVRFKIGAVRGGKLGEGAMGQSGADPRPRQQEGKNSHGVLQEECG